MAKFEKTVDGKLVARAKDLWMKGTKIRDIVTALDKEGFKNARGKTLTYQNIRGYIGQRTRPMKARSVKVPTKSWNKSHDDASRMDLVAAVSSMNFDASKKITLIRGIVSAN